MSIKLGKETNIGISFTRKDGSQTKTEWLEKEITKMFEIAIRKDFAKAYFMHRSRGNKKA